MQEVQEILEKEAERGKSFTDENLRYLNEIVIKKEINRFKGVISFLEDLKKYDLMRIKDGIVPVTFAPDIYADSNDGWIPVNPDNEDTFPKNDDYVLVSFENANFIDIGRYDMDEEGGAFYPGDDTESYVSMNLFVNAWRPLPKPYREVEDE